jgi:hypothetical protein
MDQILRGNILPKVKKSSLQNIEFAGTVKSAEVVLEK